MCLASAWSTFHASSKSLRLSFRELLVGTARHAEEQVFLVRVLLKNATGVIKKKTLLGSSGTDKNENTR